MNIIGFGLNEGSGFWRMMIPFRQLGNHGHNTYVSPNAINDQELGRADVVVLKNVVDMMGIASCQAMRELNKLKIVIDVDDALFVREDHPFKKKHDAIDSGYIFSQTIKIADAVTTTTEYLADKLRKLNKNVHVIPNFYDPTWFNAVQRRHDGPLRIGWSGSATHIEDLKLVAEVIKKIKNKYQVEIVTRGDYRAKEIFGPETEVFPTVPITHYPDALASMAIDIGICPLVDDEFNRCKSPIKAMEFGLLGIPTVCSPTVYEQIPILHTAKTQDEWIDALSELIENNEFRYSRGQNIKHFFEANYNINFKWKLWEKALK